MKVDKMSPLSRRALLAEIAVAAAAGSALASPAGALAPGRTDKGSKRIALKRGDLPEWQREVGSTFLIRGEQGGGKLKLVEVRPLHRLAHAGRSRAFAALFAPAGGAIPKGDRTYAVSHSRHGRLDVFFGPAGDRLVAIFA
jgi:hypothetical protein